jgi:ATP-dependent exoDNAse (exonuclease V) alpha subunit
VDADRIVQLVAAARLTAEQQNTAINLAISRAAVQVVIGPAGSGKTTVLATAADCWHAAGRPVLGTALAATTAQRLQTATGITSQSVARLLAAAERIDPTTGATAGLPAGVAVVIDEASMVGTRQLTRLLDLVQHTDGSIVLIGDPAQLPEIEAGGLFTAFAAQPMLAHVLAGNTRQVQAWERGALADLRAGAIDLALGQYLDHDRIHISATPDELTAGLTRDYLDRRATYGSYGVIVLASRRTDVQRLNGAIRARLQAESIVYPDAAVITGSGQTRTPLAVGDLVMVTRNDQSTGLLNGTRAQLTQVTPKRLTLHTETGQHVTVPTCWATGRLTHAYALTVHKAQGLTTQECLLYGTSALCQQAGYVALSRGRHANRLYTTLVSLDANRENKQPGFHLLTGPDPAHVLDALADRLTRGHTHTLASQQRPLHELNEFRCRPFDSRDRGNAIER